MRACRRRCRSRRCRSWCHWPGALFASSLVVLRADRSRCSPRIIRCRRRCAGRLLRLLLGFSLRARPLRLLFWLSGLALLLVWVPRWLLPRSAFAKACCLRVGADNAVDLDVTAQLFLKNCHDCIVVGRRIDSLRKGTRGVSQNQCVITEAKHARLSEHDLCNLVATPHGRAKVRPLRTHLLRDINCMFLRWFLNRLLCRFLG